MKKTTTKKIDEDDGDHMSAYKWLKRPMLPPYPDLSNASTIRDEVSAFLETYVPRKAPEYANDFLLDGYGANEPCRQAMANHLATIYGDDFVPMDNLNWHLGIIGSPDFDVSLVDAKRCLTIGEMEHPGVLGPVSVSDIAAAFQSPATGNITHGFVLPVFGRLHEHMTLSDVRYGFVSTGEYTWFCTILPGGAMAISEPVENTTQAYIYYLLYAGLQVDCPLQHDIGATSWPIQPWLDSWRIVRKMEVKEKVKFIIREGISGMKSDSLERKLKYWNLKTDFVMGARLEEEMDHCCTIMRATYKGKEVVLKIRDMSKVDNDFDTSLVSFVQEVLAYRRMKKLQGVCVPKLHGFGFASGYMLAVFVLSYGGEHMLALNPGTPAAAADAMRKVHGAGVSRGPIPGDILVSSLNPLKVMVVGFSQARSTRKASKRELRKEILDARSACGERCSDADVDFLALRLQHLKH